VGNVNGSCFPVPQAEAVIADHYVDPEVSYNAFQLLMLPDYVPDQDRRFDKHYQVLGEDSGISRPESGEKYAWKLRQLSFEKVNMTYAGADGHVVAHAMQLKG
jgi:hypothetical protein